MIYSITEVVVATYQSVSTASYCDYHYAVTAEHHDTPCCGNLQLELHNFGLILLSFLDFGPFDFPLVVFFDSPVFLSFIFSRFLSISLSAEFIFLRVFYRETNASLLLDHNIT